MNLLISLLSNIKTSLIKYLKKNTENKKAENIINSKYYNIDEIQSQQFKS